MTASSSTGLRDRIPAPRRPPSPGRDLGRIVVGVDSSFWGLTALAWAADRVRRVGADLDVCVAPSDTDASRLVDRRIAEVRRTMPTRAVPVVASVDPVAALIAESRHADLVVLGCRGTDHHGLGIGAAVAQVVVGAACDVVVVGGDPRVVGGGDHRITVLFDGALAAETVAAAVRFAAHGSTCVRIVWAVPPVEQGTVQPREEDRGPMRAAVELAQRLAPEVPVESELVRGDPSEVVAGLVHTDLVVVGDRSGLDAMARAALYHARCPVLLAHLDDDENGC